MVFGYDLGDTIRRHISRNYPANPRLFIIEMGNEGVIDSINNLIAKKADIYVEDEVVVNYYLKNNHIQGIKNSGRIDDVVFPIYIAFSNKSPKAKSYAKMLEEGIKSLKATGDLSDLKKKYNIAP
jgi:ABC-type amino acid transport substrate-binding protein